MVVSFASRLYSISEACPLLHKCALHPRCEVHAHAGGTSPRKNDNGSRTSEICAQCGHELRVMSIGILSK